MKVRDVMDHFRQIGHWVDWERTCDQVLFGDVESEVEGIAVTWIPTNEVIERAAEEGMNMLISHEPAFFLGYADSPSGQELSKRKQELLSGYGITLVRVHDTWDRMPGIGIPDAWAAHLGFPALDRPVESFYKVCLVEGLTVAEVGRRIRVRVHGLGQDWVLVCGDRTKPVERMVVGTGAITWLPWMYQEHPDADLYLVTDDGVTTFDGGLWSLDMGKPLLIVNHCTAEKPGMMSMAKYLGGQFPEVSCEYVDVDFPFRLIGT